MRTTNLIQSYISGNPYNQQYNADKAVRDFDVQKELANRTFIKPLPSNGKLVRNSIFDVPSEFRKDVYYDMKAFHHAIKGEANDHELGRLNDVGMKLGGLAIAGYLFTKKQTPMTKVFEFIGLGTFFAAMDLWPKLFIQLPAYLIHGVNVRQQYVDNYGRKKMFYQDHQFIPWDLYSDKEIDRIGDRLHVPKDIPNRREFIQEKMRKIALQNNTLWMLTAGFATPMISALLCNALEAPVAKYLSSVKAKKADKLMSNFSQEVGKYNFDKDKKQLEDLIAQNENKPLTSDVAEAIRKNLTKDVDYVVADGMYKDFEKMLSVGESFHFSQENITGIRKAIRKTFAKSGLSASELESIIPAQEEIVNALTSKNLLNGEFKDFSAHSLLVQNLVEQKIDNFAKDNPKNPAVKKLNFLMNELIHSSEFCSDSTLFKAFKQTNSTILTPELAKNLRTISEAITRLKAEATVLEKYTFVKVAQAPETGLADSWNGIQESIFKAMKYTPEEINKGHLDRELAGKILRNKIENIVSDKNSYDEFVDVIQKALSKLHQQMSTVDMTQDASINQYKSHVIDSFGRASDVFKSLGMSHTVDALVGFGDNNATSAKALMFEFIEDRNLGVKSSFYRLLNLVDMYRRVATKTNIDHAFKTIINYREVKEECVELAKSMLLEAHSSDFAVKFWQKRNPAVTNKNDLSDIEVRDGKVVNLYYGKVPEQELAELSNDREYFKSVMRMMFDGELHPDTKSRLENSGFLADFESYRKQSLDILGGDSYYVKANFLVGYAPTVSTSKHRFQLVGASTDEMAYKYFNQVFNGKTWFNMFGKMGAALVGITILSQFFFGRMKNPKNNVKEVK